MTIAQQLELRHSLHLRKDRQMQDFDVRLRMVREHQARLRDERHVDRLARGSAQVSHRPVRRRVGESLVRLGERVAGDGLGSPALTG
jgi:hypothetical protein